jgi:carboxyl-terminal processing protease
VKLSVWRERQEKVLELSITRDIIKIESVKSAKILEDRIGYINLVEFQENTPRHLEEALAKLKKEGMDSLILDLRNNPGGLLDIAVSVAEKFLEKDSPIVSTKSRIKGQNVDFKSKNASAHTGFPVVVLINEGSASASEIVAGAIQDNRRGIVVGMKSYGKGSVQTVLPMRDSSALRLTTASYYTPSGRPIRKEGIIPDVAVEQKEYPGMSRNKKFEIFENLEAKPEGVTETEKPLAGKKEEPKDFQLERAIDIIKGIKAYKKVKA